VYTHTLQPTLQTTETGKGERARASASKRERECESQGASEGASEGAGERRTETKPSYQTADNPPSPRQQNTTRLMQQQVQRCQAEAAGER